MKQIGFVGLGMMGAPMAANLLRGGFEVTAFDVDRSRAEGLVGQGAVAAAGLAELAGCDAVIVMVNTDGQARSVIGELVGWEQGRPSAIFCMSTIQPATVRELGERAAARGVGLLDAPVSGGRIVAELGRLAIMVGGEADLFERALPVFRAMGSTIVGVISAKDISIPYFRVILEI